ncbi:MAG TPA: Rid family hydrolase [Opitutaceae bacterium]|nr:Rid family hydrolase [Opitutaceae bacterium]
MFPPTLRAAESIAPGTAVERIARAERNGMAASVRVPDGPMVFTGLVTAPNAVMASRAQVEGALEELARTLAKAGSDLSRVVRLNAYVASDSAVSDVESAVAARFAGAPVAFTLVHSVLTTTGSLVAFDAVATTSRTATTVEIVTPSAAILPAGGKIFVSGQAERGTDVASAVKLTMAGLHRTLAHHQLKKTDVVQVKAFIMPFSDHAAAAREIAASFDGASVPPIVLVHWLSELHAEIELVAADRGPAGVPRERISYSWLPWLPPATRYSRVAHVAAGTPLIFIGGIDGGATGDAREQMKKIFERLGSVLFDAGSSYRHLAKATYYLHEPAARVVLGEIRDVYYDPARPPAASALEVTSLGRSGYSARVDLIAVPAR